MKRKILISLGIIIILLVVLPLIYIAYDRSLMPPAPVPQYTVPPFTHGEPWEQYATRFLKTSKKPNALEHYMKAFDQFTQSSVLFASEEITPIIKNGWTQPYPKAEEALQINQAVIKELMLGTQIKHCELPPTPFGYGTPFPNWLHLSVINSLLLLSGKKLEMINQPSSALDYYLAGVQFGKDFGQKDQEFISYLISIAMINKSNQQIRQLIARSTLTEADYRKIITELNRIDQEQTKFGDFLYEYEYHTRYPLINKPFKWYFTEAIQGGNRQSTILKRIKDRIIGIYVEMKIYLNQGRYLKQKYELAMLAKTKPYSDFVEFDWKQRGYPKYCYSMSYTRVLNESTFLRISQIQAAIQLYFLEKKQWPKGLDDLKPYFKSLPLDPFTDKPFLWSIDSAGKPFAYSVGPDFKNDSAKLFYDPTNGVISAGDVFP